MRRLLALAALATAHSSLLYSGPPTAAEGPFSAPLAAPAQPAATQAELMGAPQPAPAAVPAAEAAMMGAVAWSEGVKPPAVESPPKVAPYKQLGKGTGAHRRRYHGGKARPGAARPECTAHVPEPDGPCRTRLWRPATRSCGCSCR